MKANVSLAIVTAVSASIVTGCGSTRRDCVDQNGNIIPDVNCQNRTTSRYIYPHYIYGGSYSNGRISGGSLTPPSTSSSRGGFGSFGSSSS